jgi:hypothetical protein
MNHSLIGTADHEHDVCEPVHLQSGATAKHSYSMNSNPVQTLIRRTTGARRTTRRGGDPTASKTPERTIQPKPVLAYVLWATESMVTDHAK